MARVALAGPEIEAHLSLRRLRPSASVRRRTLRLMSRLLALAAASATLCACSNSRATDDNAPSLGTGPAPSPTPVGRGLANALGVREHPPGGDKIAACCRWQPPTLRLPQIARTIHASATWKSPSMFRLQLSEPRGWAAAAYSASDALVNGGTVVSSTVRADSAKFDIQFEPDSESVTLYIPLQCLQCNPQKLRAAVERADGAGLRVTLGDVW